LDFTTLRFLNRRIASPDPKIGIVMAGSFRNDLGFFEMTFFATSGFLNRRIASPDPKIGIVMAGSFRNDLGFFEMTFFATSGFLNRRIVSLRFKNRDRYGRLISK